SGPAQWAGRETGPQLGLLYRETSGPGQWAGRETGPQLGHRQEPGVPPLGPALRWGVVSGPRPSADRRSPWLLYRETSGPAQWGRPAHNSATVRNRASLAVRLRGLDAPYRLRQAANRGDHLGCGMAVNDHSRT